MKGRLFLLVESAKNITSNVYAEEKIITKNMQTVIYLTIYVT
jgi:hypothetical protein